MDHSMEGRKGCVICSKGVEELQLFLLAGQSNMAGRGGTFVLADSGYQQAGVRWDGILPVECHPMPGKILVFNEAREWVTATEPLHNGIDKSKVCGVGPGMAFARSLLALQAKTSQESGADAIGLIPSAVGNTSIEEWAVGKDLFSAAVGRTVAALSSSPGSRLSGLLWYQGESDADVEERALSYRQKLLRVLLGFREALSSPNLPVVQVAIHSTRASLPFVQEIREVQLNLRLEGLVTVDAREFCSSPDDDLPDELHLSTRAQCSLGQAMAERYVSLAKAL